MPLCHDIPRGTVQAHQSQDMTAAEAVRIQALKKALLWNPQR